MAKQLTEAVLRCVRTFSSSNSGTVPQGKNASDGAKKTNIRKKTVIGETRVFSNSGQRGAVAGWRCLEDAGAGGRQPMQAGLPVTTLGGFNPSPVAGLAAALGGERAERPRGAGTGGCPDPTVAEEGPPWDGEDKGAVPGKLRMA